MTFIESHGKENQEINWNNVTEQAIFLEKGKEQLKYFCLHNFPEIIILWQPGSISSLDCYITASIYGSCAFHGLLS